MDRTFEFHPCCKPVDNEPLEIVYHKDSYPLHPNSPPFQQRLGTPRFRALFGFYEQLHACFPQLFAHHNTGLIPVRITENLPICRGCKAVDKGILEMIYYKNSYSLHPNSPPFLLSTKRLETPPFKALCVLYGRTTACIRPFSPTPKPSTIQI